MCGISGYLNLKNDAFHVDEILLQKMQASMIHRGPDGGGIWANQKYQIGLAHRRLSIVDLSSAGHQPMMNKEQSVIISFNGEIYNHALLRKELELLGHSYFSNTDTETILYAYKQWGIDFIHKLEGMFAIALFDLRKNEFYLIRDRVGIKPLYFSVQSEILSFASEIKTLWVLPWIKKELSKRAFYHTLTFMSAPAPLTLYKGVYKLPAGHYVKVDSHRNYTFHEWYNPGIVSTEYAQKDFYNEDFCVENIRRLLRESVQKRMMSDVPFGVFLSGGIDSSLNVALMSEFTDQVKTFNVSFSDQPENSEVEWARKVSRKFNTKHHEIVISEKEAFQFYDQMIYHQDEPISDCVCIPLYYVSKLLKDSGVTVVQIGEGSDELFCGYNSYAKYIDIYKRYWKPTQNLVPKFLKQAFYSACKTVFPDKKYHLDVVKNWMDNKALFWGGAIAFTEMLKDDFLFDLKDDFDPVLEKIYPGFDQSLNSYSMVDYHLNKLKQIDPNADFVKQMVYLELKQRLPELLLMRADKMCMATSVEGRVPFLDHKLVEFAMQIPMSLKYKNRTPKYILKKACEGILPYDVIYRKKMGFAAPTSRWFKQGEYFPKYFDDMIRSKKDYWADIVDLNKVYDAIEKTKSGKDYALQLWVLQNIMAFEVTS